MKTAAVPTVLIIDNDAGMRRQSRISSNRLVSAEYERIHRANTVTTCSLAQQAFKTTRKQRLAFSVPHRRISGVLVLPKNSIADPLADNFSFN
jgi:hypothetical protein